MRADFPGTIACKSSESGWSVLTRKTGKSFLFTIALVAGVVVLRFLLRSVARLLLRGRDELRPRFWTHQGISLFSALLLIVGFPLPSGSMIPGGSRARWAHFRRPWFAMQKVVTSLAGYFVILRGRTFNVGDRIKMGGVRGDVLALGFTQTTVAGKWIAAFGAKRIPRDVGEEPPIHRAGRHGER